MAARDDQVETTGGTVVGFSRDGVSRWRSIPYARPPVGALRLRAPQPPIPWRGARYCHQFGFIAPQKRLFTAMDKFAPMSEDCLTLNVIAPQQPSEEPLPVMFWVHGGAYIMGSSQAYDRAAAPLARRGCVFVSANYRLGALGTMDLSSLSNQDTAIDGNLFLRDLVMALQWVHDNIAGFGGDPDNVTIFGESAGGHAVGTLLAVPAAKGLFARVISESSGEAMIHTADEAAEFAARLVGLLGAHPDDGATALLQADPARLVAATEQLMDATGREKTGAVAIGAAVDGDVLPRHPIQAMARGEAHPVPLIVGRNLDEATLFARGVLPYLPTSEPLIERMLAEVGPTVRDQLIAAYPGYPDPAVCVRLGGDRLLGLNAWQVGRAHGKHAPTYLYRYDFAPRLLRRLGLGAAHGTEIFALFDLYRTKLGRLLTLPGDRRSALRVSDDIQHRWLTFARTGVPGTGWPAYTEDHRAEMIFDRTSRLELALDESRRQAWEVFSAALAKTAQPQTTLSTQ